jgi:hypothetical protein
MGLDTFASRSADDIELQDDDLQAFVDADISLCGGIFSGGGNDGSFRGKVYAELILEVTGQSLYAEWIPPEIVKEMYTSLKVADPEEAAAWGYRNTAQEVLELCKFFKVCSERRLGLLGWW